MRTAQVLLSFIIALAVGGSVTGLNSEPRVLVGSVLISYVVIRWSVAFIGRTVSLRSRRGASEFGQRCGNCGLSIRRQPPDIVLTCHRCGWKKGLPVLRYLTDSTITYAVRRSVSGTGIKLGVVAVVLLSSLVWAPLIPAVAVSSIDTGGSNEQINVTAAERQILQRVNDRRAQRDMPPLNWNSQAAGAAEEHAEHMAENEYFSHTEPNGQTQQERYAFCDGGENAAKSHVRRSVRYDYDGGGEYFIDSTSDLSRWMVKGWMHSEPHRERGIYGQYWNSAGVGIAVADDGRTYAVLGFCS